MHRVVKSALKISTNLIRMNQHSLPAVIFLYNIIRGIRFYTQYAVKEEDLKTLQRYAAINLLFRLDFIVIPMLFIIIMMPIGLFLSCTISIPLQGILSFICSNCGATRIYTSSPHKYPLTFGWGGAI